MTNPNPVADNLAEAYRNLKAALDDYAAKMQAAVNALRDKDEELRVVHDQNERLEQDNRRLQERLAQTENDLWQSRREAREAKGEMDTAQAQAKALETKLSALETEAKGLREIVLNVAALADPIINPRPLPSAAGSSGGVASGIGDGQEAKPVPEPQGHAEDGRWTSGRPWNAKEGRYMTDKEIQDRKDDQTSF